MCIACETHFRRGEKTEFEGIGVEGCVETVGIEIVDDVIYDRGLSVWELGSNFRGDVCFGNGGGVDEEGCLVGVVCNDET